LFILFVVLIVANQSMKSFEKVAALQISSRPATRQPSQAGFSMKPETGEISGRVRI